MAAVAGDAAQELSSALLQEVAPRFGEMGGLAQLGIGAALLYTGARYKLAERAFGTVILAAQWGAPVHGRCFVMELWNSVSRCVRTGLPSSIASDLVRQYRV